ncbi:hypothetical protein MTR67_017378 [Solanum verrucosum]|uniref:Mediator complex subunit 15 KIX domain-containing protein n=1 Tax=Solanum verrucosum TaxID=315347 RepID=A0AAF0TRQ4_SOLVR|nr:hypothetical protein MTR67_017378 [Solanum verrucosum]
MIDVASVFIVDIQGSILSNIDVMDKALDEKCVLCWAVQAQAQAPGGGEGSETAAGAMIPNGDLKEACSVSGQERVQELKEIAVTFEEKIYSTATSQQDYFQKISSKMLIVETRRSQNLIQPNPASSRQNALGRGSHNMQSQVNSQAQQLPVPTVANQTQTRQPLLQQNLQNNMASTGLQNSASLAPALPSVSNLTQGTMPNVLGQNSNLQIMLNVGQNSVGNAIGQNSVVIRDKTYLPAVDESKNVANVPEIFNEASPNK